MELRGATASHVGNVRDANQDRVHFSGYTGVVADGMGGHQGGEMAASIAISEFVNVIDPIAPGGLVELVEDANRAVFERAADPDLRGMGTTLVALTLRPSEEKISIVNVGDSRAYFLRGDEFGQLTLDHSLVEDLVRQKRLTPEEALTHPNRNILTRALGIASQVEVDRFLVPARLGDRFLLCSDGLFNEVSEEDIIKILQENTEPADAADRLVEAALAAAGRDNVTVAVIDVVPDGNGGNTSSEAAETLMVPAAVPDGGNGGAVAEVAADGGAAENGAAEAGYQGQAAVGVDVAEPEVSLEHGEDEAPVAEYENGHAPDLDYDDITPDETSEIPTPQPKKKRRGLLGFLGLGVIGLLAAGAYFGVNWWVGSQWYVDVNTEEQLAVFRGRPEGFLWTEPTQEATPGGELQELTPDAQNQVTAQPSFENQADAEAFIAGLEREPEQAVDPELLDDTAASAAGGLTDDIKADEDAVENEGSEGNTDNTGEGDSSSSTPAPPAEGDNGGGGAGSDPAGADPENPDTGN